MTQTRIFCRYVSAPHDNPPLAYIYILFFARALRSKANTCCPQVLQKRTIQIIRSTTQAKMITRARVIGGVIIMSRVLPNEALRTKKGTSFYAHVAVGLHGP